VRRKEKPRNGFEHSAGAPASQTAPHPAPDASGDQRCGPGPESAIAQAASGAGRAWIIGLRVAVLVVVLGGWELAARLKWIDPFFYSMPSMIWDQIGMGARRHLAGPLWRRCWSRWKRPCSAF
jgi:NitT/TauT family transport system permease protein